MPQPFPTQFVSLLINFSIKTTTIGQLLEMINIFIVITSHHFLLQNIEVASS